MGALPAEVLGLLPRRRLLQEAVRGRGRQKLVTDICNTPPDCTRHRLYNLQTTPWIILQRKFTVLEGNCRTIDIFSL